MIFTFHDLFNIGFALTIGYYSGKLAFSMLILAFNLFLSTIFGDPKDNEGIDDEQ